MHNGLSSTLSEGIVKLGTVVLCEVIASKGLATVLVNTLKDLRNCEPMRFAPAEQSTNLISSRITKTGEERGELASKGSGSVVLEDDLVERTGRCDLVAFASVN